MEMTFKNTGSDFSGYHAATAWLKANGYSYGSMQRDDPAAIYKGDCDISKWRYLSARERENADGRIEAGDRRFGDVVVTLNEPAMLAERAKAGGGK